MMASVTGLGGAGTIALGVIAGIFSTCIQSIGLTLQRKSHILENEKDMCLQRPPYLRRRWQVGVLLFVLANIFGSGIQITTLPLPVLSALQASGLVFNTACASLLLAEPFTPFSVVGTVLVAVGALLIATFGAIAEPSHNLEQLLLLLGRPQFIAWMATTFTIIGCILAGSSALRIFRPQTPLSGRANYVRGMCNGAVSGVLSAHTLLVAKSAVELVVRTVADGHNQFKRWESWVILAMLAGLALTQLYFLHEGLKLVSTSVLYPFVFCVYNVVAILDGLIYFRQTSRLTVSHGVFVAIGTVVLLAGVMTLSWRLEEPDPAEAGPGRYGRVQLGSDETVADDLEHSLLDDSSFLSPGRVFPLGFRRKTDDGRGSGTSERSPLLGRRYSSARSPGPDFCAGAAQRYCLLEGRGGVVRPHRHSTATVTSSLLGGTGDDDDDDGDDDTDNIWTELTQDSLAPPGPHRQLLGGTRRFSLPLFQKLAVSRLDRGGSGFAAAAGGGDASGGGGGAVAVPSQARRTQSGGVAGGPAMLSVSAESVMAPIEPRAEGGARPGERSVLLRPLWADATVLDRSSARTGGGGGDSRS